MISWLRRTAPALLRPEGAMLSLGVLAFVIWLLWRSLFPAVPEVDVTRIEGADRYDTAAQLALAARPDGADAAILARGDDFPDGLAAASLVGPTDGVLLLTEGSRLPEVTRAALVQLDVSTVYLSGGEAAIEPSVEAELARTYRVVRIDGANRFATAAAVARQLAELDGIGIVEGRRTAFVVSGEDFPDALAAASASAAGGYPILLATPDALPDETVEALADLQIRRVIVVGGPASLGLPVTIALQQGDYLVENVAGADRSFTAAAVADRFVRSTLTLDDETVVVARGDVFPDALAAASFAGIEGAPLLLAPAPSSAGDGTLVFVGDRVADGGIDRLVVVGGPSAVTPAVVDRIEQVATGAEPPPERTAAPDASE